MTALTQHVPPLLPAVPAGSYVEAFGSMAAAVGAVVAVAAVVCAAAAGLIHLFPQLIVRAPEAQVDLETAEVLTVFPDASDEVRRRVRPVLRATLIWACGGAVLSVVGAIVSDPSLIYPTLSMLIAAGILLVIVAAGYRLAGTRTLSGIKLKHLIYASTITTIVASAALVLLTLIASSPAVAGGAS
ncbi:hypothetical protein [Microbacterium sp. NPDC055665]